jgi:Helix-turn-helix domain
MSVDGQLHTAAEAASILKVRESWLRTKAAARLIPCTFVGKHLRFSDHDIEQIMQAGARQPVTERAHRPAHPRDAPANHPGGKAPRRGGRSHS